MSGNMDGVENTSSSTSKTVENVLSTPTEYEIPLKGSESAENSMHNPNNSSLSKSGKKPKDTSVSYKTPIENTSAWKTVQRRKQFQIALSTAHLSALKDDIAIKDFVSNLLKDFDGLTYLGFSTISQQKFVVVSYDNAMSANRACLIPVSEENAATFKLLSEIHQHSVDNSYILRIKDVPLDIDRHMLQTHLSKLGAIKSIKFALQGLYYLVTVSYQDNSSQQLLKDKWSISFQKQSFHIAQPECTPANLNKWSQYILKLTYLPKG